MAGEANIWNPRSVLQASADSLRVEESLIATEGQVLFVLTTFTYELNSGALEVFKNGLFLTKGEAWIESSESSFYIMIPCTAGDKIDVVGFTAITAESPNTNGESYNISPAAFVNMYAAENATPEAAASPTPKVVKACFTALGQFSNATADLDEGLLTANKAGTYEVTFTFLAVGDDEYSFYLIKEGDLLSFGPAIQYDFTLFGGSALTFTLHGTVTLEEGESVQVMYLSAAGEVVTISYASFSMHEIVPIGFDRTVSVPTMADLLAANLPNDLATITMLGFHTPGDGGGGVFYWDSTSVATANTGTIVQPTAVTGAGRWLRAHSDHINIKWFGAVGDGVTDDWAAYRNALRFCSLNGKTMYVPEGVFFIGIGQGGMTLLGSLRMVGEGYNSIILREEVKDVAASAVIAYTSATRLDSLEVKGIHFKGQYDSVQWSGTSTFIGGSNIDNVSISDCYFVDTFSFAMAFTNCKNVLVSRNYLNNTGRDGARFASCNVVTVTNNLMTRTFDDAIAVHTNDTTSTDLLVKTQVNATGNQITECSRGIAILGAQDINVSGNTLTRCGLAGIVAIHNPAGPEGENTPYNISINNNVIVDMLPQVWSVDNWVTHEWRSVITASEPVRAIEVTGISSGNTGTKTYEIGTNGYPLQPYGLVSALDSTSELDVATTGAVSIHGNIISRTIEFGGMFSDAGYGLPWAKNGVSADLAYNSESGRVIGIRLNGDFADVSINNNSFSGLYEGIAFRGTFGSGANSYCHSMDIKNNKFIDIQTAALSNINTYDSLYMDFGSIRIIGNDFDLDPFYLGIEDQDQTIHVDTKYRRDNGSWNITGITAAYFRVRACFITRGVVTGSVVMQHNSFKNVSVIVGENVDTVISQPATLIFGQNILHIGIGSTDVALGNNNLGIAQRLKLGQWTVFVYYDADIASPSFGEYQETLYSSSTIPVSGYYTLGHMVVRANPFPGGFFYLVRATSGTGHVLGTDWLQINAA